MHDFYWIKNGTALHPNLRNKNFDIVHFLINNGADRDLNVEMDNGDTPLTIAVSIGNKEIIELLLKHGADINVQNRLKSALHVAAYNNDVATMKLLIDYGGDIILLISSNVSPLLAACLSYSKDVIMKLM